MDTEYPFEDKVSITLTGGNSNLYFRIPGWCKKASAFLNGKPIKLKKDPRGFISVSSAGWKGDRLELHFPMEVVFSSPDRRIKESKGLTAVTYGPVLFCAEATDNPGRLPNMYVTEKKAIYSHKGDFPVITVSCREATETGEEDKVLTLVPYYMWDNRQPGEMTVWLNTAPRSYPSLTKSRPAVEYDEVKQHGPWMTFRSCCTTLEDGSTIEFNMTGSGFRVTCLGVKDAGILEVSCDGKPLGEIDEYSENEYEEIAKEFATTPGRHTITLKATGRKKPASQGNYVNFVRAELLR